MHEQDNAPAHSSIKTNIVFWKNGHLQQSVDIKIIRNLCSILKTQVHERLFQNREFGEETPKVLLDHELFFLKDTDFSKFW